MQATRDQNSHYRNGPDRDAPHRTAEPISLTLDTIMADMSAPDQSKFRRLTPHGRQLVDDALQAIPSTVLEDRKATKGDPEAAIVNMLSGLSGQAITAINQLPPRMELEVRVAVRPSRQQKKAADSNYKHKRRAVLRTWAQEKPDQLRAAGIDENGIQAMLNGHSPNATQGKGSGWTIEHIVARGLGGDNDPNNLILMSSRQNSFTNDFDTSQIKEMREGEHRLYVGITPAPGPREGVIVYSPRPLPDQGQPIAKERYETAQRELEDMRAREESQNPFSRQEEPHSWRPVSDADLGHSYSQQQGSHGQGARSHEQQQHGRSHSHRRKHR